MERVGPYVLVQPIYRWGWADVFLAVEAPEGRPRRVVWWARLSPDWPWPDEGFVRRWQDLLEALRRQVADPMLALPVDWDLTAEPPFLVFEPIPGKSFAEVLQAGRDQFLPVSIDQALACAHQLTTALQTLHGLTFHDRPAFHGLLSPTQAFVTWEGQFRLVYGGALQALEGQGSIPPSVRQALDPYLAPEQRSGETLGSPASDVYTASRMCLEFLTNRPAGELPPDLPTWLMEQTVYLRTGDVVPLPEDLQMLFLRSLHPDPRQRFPQIALLKDPLDEKAFSGEYEASTFHLAFYLNTLFRDFPEREHKYYQNLLTQDYTPLFAPPPPTEAPAAPTESPPTAQMTIEDVVLYPSPPPPTGPPRRGLPLMPVLIALIILAFGGGAVWLLQRRMSLLPPPPPTGPSPETVALRQQLEENQRRIAELQQVIQQLQTAQQKALAGTPSSADDAQVQQLRTQLQELVKQNEDLQRRLQEKEKTSVPPSPPPAREVKAEAPETRPTQAPSPTPTTASLPAVEKTPPAAPPHADSTTAPTPPKQEPTPPPTETPPASPPAEAKPAPPRVESPPPPAPEFVLETDLDARVEPVGPCVPTDPRLGWIRNRYPGPHRVIAQIYLNESGQPLRVEVLRAPVDLLGEIARDTWMNCRFRRPTRSGQPVKAVVTRVLVFEK